MTPHPHSLPTLQLNIPCIAPEQSLAECVWLAQIRHLLMQGPPRGTITMTTKTTLRLGMN